MITRLSVTVTAVPHELIDYFFDSSALMNLREKLDEIKSTFLSIVISRSAIVFLSMSLGFVIAVFMRIYPAICGWYLISLWKRCCTDETNRLASFLVSPIFPLPVLLGT
jgi:hypothetical protein